MRNSKLRANFSSPCILSCVKGQLLLLGRRSMFLVSTISFFFFLQNDQNRKANSGSDKPAGEFLVNLAVNDPLFLLSSIGAVKMCALISQLSFRAASVRLERGTGDCFLCFSYVTKSGAFSLCVNESAHLCP